MANVFLQFLLDAEHGDADAVKRNIENGINLEARDEDQQTALILAARCDRLECVQVLIQSGADVNAQDVDNWTALLNACQNGNLDIVSLLVQHDPQLEHTDCGQFTPLMWASYQGHTRVVEYLLSCGMNTNAVDNHGISSLSWAAGRNHIDIVALLLAADASPNLCDKNNTTPLIWASRRGFTGVVDLLLKYNASVNNIGMKTMTALLAATKGGHAETALRLLENRTIDIKIQDKDGQTPLSHACAQGLSDVVAELVHRHAYVNTVDKNGDPVLFAAIKGGKEECVALVLENHADVNVIGSENKTAIWWAVERGRLDVVKHLLRYNPDIEVSGGPDDDTPLLLATKRKRVGIVYELIRYGAKLSSVDRFGDNSLHIALRNHSRDIADILLSNPRHAKFLYRPNKRGETPYKIDASLQKSILTNIFGQRTLNINDDSILGYDLYSSALAEILSEPSLRTPITVGLYAKWGSGKSALLTHLKDEMRSFAQLTDFPSIKFSPLLLTLIFILASIIGLITGFTIHYIVGLSLSVTSIILPLVFLFLIQYLLRHKDYRWSANVARLINRRLEIIRFLLQVLFMNPYAHRRLQTNDTTDCKKMKFIFTEYGKISTAEGEKASASMIAELSMRVEETFGIVATRLCRALHSKDLSLHRFRYICCIPAFIFITIQISLIITLVVLAIINGVPASHRVVNMVYVILGSLLGVSMLFSFGPYFRLLLGLMKSPKSKIMKFFDHSSHLNESSLYRLRKEVGHLSYIIKTVEAFLSINTRLVVLIDGLDVCEHQRVLQILDQIHVLLTKDNDPFITLIVCDRHKMMQDMNITTAASSSTNQNNGFDTAVNGHEYLLSIIQLPIYLQLNLSKTKQLKNNVDGFPRRRQTTLGNGTSILDVSAKPITANKLSKNKRRRQRRDTLPNTKPVTTSELMHSLLQSDYLLDINPRILQRLINIIAMSGRLLRANQVLFSWKRLGCWSYLVEQWPFRISWMIVFYEDHEQEYGEDTILKTLYDKIKPFIPIANEPLLKLDRSGRKFEHCLEHSEPVLNIADLKQFLPCTCNLDPYLNKLIRESAGYFYMNNPDEIGDSARFFSHPDPNFNGHATHYPPPTTSRYKGGFHPKCHPNRFNPPGNSCHPYAQVPFKRRDDDDPHHHHCHHRTSSICSSTVLNAPLLLDQPILPNPHSENVKVDLSPYLSEMTVNDIADCLKNDIIGLKAAMIPIYTQDINENNISGRVLATCELEELKSILSMAFGDWVLFCNWVKTKRESERRSRFHSQSSSVPKSNSRDQQNLSNDNYQFSTDSEAITAALGQLFSSTSSNTNDLVSNENKVSIVSAPKNVKFIIPLSRSGLDSNENTFGVVDSTTRTITHVKDIFPLNSFVASSTPNHPSMANPSLSSTFDTDEQQDTSKDDCEDIPLLFQDHSNEK